MAAPTILARGAASGVLSVWNGEECYARRGQTLFSRWPRGACNCRQVPVRRQFKLVRIQIHLAIQKVFGRQGVPTRLEGDFQVMRRVAVRVDGQHSDSAADIAQTVE